MERNNLNEGMEYERVGEGSRCIKLKHEQ